MKVAIATCFESNEERLVFVYEACKSRNYETCIITSDFSHIHKKKRKNIPESFVAIPTEPYKKNISFGRLHSHRKFSKNAFELIEKYSPDLIWLMAPANSLILEADKYKKKNPHVRIIIDMIDMWPESLPRQINKSVFPLNLWKNIRSRHIGCADFLVTECDLYQDVLKREFGGRMRTIYWSRDSKAVQIKPDLPKDRISLCYIGSINNIIDIDRIESLIAGSDMPVDLHVIGYGEKKEEMVERLSCVCQVHYYGEIRDEEQKSEIFRKCHAGINVYKEGLYIGLTVKCIDYFEHGLPIINNIKGDTWKLVEENHAGINVEKDTVICSGILQKMRQDNQNIYGLFNSRFTKESFIYACLQVIDEVLE